MSYINFLNNEIPSILLLALIIISLIFITILIISYVKKIEINVKGLGFVLIIQLFIFTTILIWTLILNFLVCIAFFMFIISLCFQTIDSSVICVQMRLLTLLILSHLLNFLIYILFNQINEQLVQNKDKITNKYISFLVKVMTALTLFATGLYTMFFDQSLWGVGIAMLSLLTVALSFIEIYRIIKKGEWK
ncbi:hypothetical protein [Staphylococcus capitis]|uniref:hypothetical protein n=1 Tax=Staphylococcus capitis TaxID=29388 RepID=UPI0011A7D313|nr:hypothetical protein [Staphylococcus capitis]